MTVTSGFRPGDECVTFAALWPRPRRQPIADHTTNMAGDVVYPGEAQDIRHTGLKHQELLIPGV